MVLERYDVMKFCSLIKVMTSFCILKPSFMKFEVYWSKMDRRAPFCVLNIDPKNYKAPVLVQTSFFVCALIRPVFLFSRYFSSFFVF